MNDRLAKSKQIVENANNRLNDLRNVLADQKAILQNLNKLAEELMPDFKNASLPNDLPEEYQKKYNDTLHEINDITNLLTKNVTSSKKQVKRQKNMV